MAPKAKPKTAQKVAPKAAPAPVINPALVPDLASPSDTKPADVTLYLKIDLTISDQQPKTAVYVPDRARLGNKLDVILYLYGHKHRGIFPELKGKTIDSEELLKLPRDGTKLYYPLREEIAKASKKNFVFVAPTLGNYSQGGSLINKDTGAGDPLGFLLQVIRGLQKHLSLPKLTTLNQLVLAAHSGGGDPMRHLAAHPDIRNKVKEVWCFDCLYSWQDPKFWTKWSAPTDIYDYIYTEMGGKPNRRLFIHTTGKKWVRIDDKKPPTPDNRRPVDGTFSESSSVKNQTAKRSNVQVELMTRTLDHHESPVAWIKDLIDRSGVLT